MGLFSNDTPDTAGGEPKPLNGSEAAAVSAATEKVKSGRGGYRPGSGRKPKPANQVVAQSGTNAPEAPAPEASEADIEFVRTIAEAGLKILDRVETNLIVTTIESIGDKYLMEKTDVYLRRREIGPGDVEVVVNAAGAMAAKYSFLTRYAPEAALLAWAATHGMAFQSVLADLKMLAKQIKELKAKGVRDSQGGYADSPPSN